MKGRTLTVAILPLMMLFFGLGSRVCGDELPDDLPALGLAGIEVIADSDASDIRGSGGTFSFGDLTGFAGPSFSSTGGFSWSGSGGAGDRGTQATVGSAVGWSSPLVFRVDQGGKSYRASLSGGLLGAGGGLVF